MRRRFLLSLLASDLAALSIGIGAASLLVFETALPWQARGVGASIWPLVGLLAGGMLAGSYVSLRMWARGAPRASYGRGVSIVLFMGAFTAVGILVTRGYWSRPFLGVTLGVTAALALLHRAYRRRRPWLEEMVLVTAEKGLVDDLRSTPHADVFSLYDPAGEPPGEPFEDDPTLVIDLRPVLSDQMAQFVSSWNLAGYPMRPLATVYEEHTGRLPIVHLADGWELTAPVARNEYANFKRGIDIFLTVISSVIWMPLSALIWAAVRIDSRGPALYKQQRVGRDGSRFTLYKFRTMVPDAEPNGPQFAAVGDSRMTRVGRWLRRFRLDELPQLWNVLKGDLSLVGPRPERPVFTDKFEETIPFYGYRHLIRPGVTGWAQVNYGYADGEADTVEKLTYDLYYVKHMSPWLDLHILGKSIWTVVSGFGAQ